MLQSLCIQALMCLTNPLIILRGHSSMYILILCIFGLFTIGFSFYLDTKALSLLSWKYLLVFKVDVLLNISGAYQCKVARDPVWYLDLWLGKLYFSLWYTVTSHLCLESLLLLCILWINLRFFSPFEEKSPYIYPQVFYKHKFYLKFTKTQFTFMVSSYRCNSC